MKLIGDQIRAFPKFPGQPSRHIGDKERKRSSPTHPGLGFGLQNFPNLQRAPRSHTNSDLDVLPVLGKLIKSTFQRIQCPPVWRSESFRPTSFVHGAQLPYFVS